MKTDKQIKNKTVKDNKNIYNNYYKWVKVFISYSPFYFFSLSGIQLFMEDRNNNKVSGICETLNNSIIDAGFDDQGKVLITDIINKLDCSSVADKVGLSKWFFIMFFLVFIASGVLMMIGFTQTKEYRNNLVVIESGGARKAVQSISSIGLMVLFSVLAGLTVLLFEF